MKPRPLINWFRELDVELSKAECYYYTSDDHDDDDALEYFYKVDQTILPKLQRELQISRNPEQAISELDSTSENAFHYILSRKLFGDDFLYLKNVYIISDWLKARTATNMKNLSPNFNGYVDVNSFKQLFAQRIAKSIDEYVGEQVAEILKILLSVFPDNEKGNEKLYFALAHQNHNVAAPLHYAFKYLLDGACDDVFARISKMYIPQQYKIATLGDKTGKTIFHYAAKQSDTKSFARIKDAFGLENVKAAFNVEDVDKNRLLHEACSPCIYTHPGDRAYKIWVLCDLLVPSMASTSTECDSSQEQKTTTVSLANAFQQNTQGMNPLHIFCKTRTNESEKDGGVMALLRNTLGKSFAEKMLEQDINGNTPLHYAIETGCMEVIRELLVKTLSSADEQGLSKDEIEKLVLVENRKKETPIHLALRRGDAQILEALISNLSHAKLRELNYAPKLSAVLKKSKIKQDYLDYIKRRNASFEAVEYFVSRARRFGRAKDDDFHLRLKDLKECFNALEEKKDLPVENPRFFVKKTLLSTTKYHKLRLSLSNVTPEELAECKDYYLYHNKLSATQTNMVLDLFGIKCEAEGVVNVSASVKQELVSAPINFLSQPLSKPVSELVSAPQRSSSALVFENAFLNSPQAHPPAYAPPLLRDVGMLYPLLSHSPSHSGMFANQVEGASAPVMSDEDDISEVIAALPVRKVKVTDKNSEAPERVPLLQV